jgi:HEAT repeat protein
LITLIAGAVLALAIDATPRDGAVLRAQTTAETAAELVQDLKDFRPALPPVPPRGERLVTEQRREAIYARLWSLGAAAMPALVAGLADADLRVRQNVALFLNVIGGGWSQLGPRQDLRPYLPALVRALDDDDSRVRALSAQAIVAIGEAAAPAVVPLTRLLVVGDEGGRLWACAALGAIGSAAREGLPALRAAMSDPSPVVSNCARVMIAKIER